MVASSSSVPASDSLRYSEYMAGPPGTSGANIDRTLSHYVNLSMKRSLKGGTLIAVGLGVAAAAFAGRFTFQLWKPLGQVIMENAKKSKLHLSYYYKGGFEQKMNQREASLILGVSPSASKSKIRAAHRKIMILNHPDKGGSPYIAMKLNEAKDLLESSTKQ